MRNLVLSLAAVALTACASAPAAPSNLLEGAWGAAEIDPILDKTRRLRLTMEPGVLTPAEEAAVVELLVAGQVLHRLYLEQRHPQGVAAADALGEHGDLEGLNDLFRLAKGPIATTLDNVRAPFLNVAAEAPGKNVYPAGTTREVFDAYLADHPERTSELLHLRYVVQDANPANVRRALRTLDARPELNRLHPGLRARLSGANTATILPNEGHLSRQYGRTILIRSNILTNKELFEGAEETFNAAVVDAHHGDLTPEGRFYRTLWHEIGHYLGADETETGGDLGVALQDTADLLEEMKSDLVSLTAARMLRDRGFHDDARLRAIYAGGVRRVLQTNQPRREQAYQIMQLIQWNWFLEHGVLSFDGERLTIHYERYPDAVRGLLAEVLELQRGGDRDSANAFVDEWTSWDEELHGVIAARMRDAAQHRFNLVRYEALGE